MKTIFNLSLILLLFVTSCTCNTCGVPSTVNVKCYKQKNQVVDSDPTNDWIYWYVIMNNNGGCYYYQSYSPVNDYSSVSWTQSNDVPSEITSSQTEIVSNESVSMENLSPDTQSDISSDYDNGSGDDGSGDSGNGDSGSGDTGSGDSGGDSGGGDSGGGGGE